MAQYWQRNTLGKVSVPHHHPEDGRLVKMASTLCSMLGRQGAGLPLYLGHRRTGLEEALVYWRPGDVAQACEELIRKVTCSLRAILCRRSCSAALKNSGWMSWSER